MGAEVPHFALVRVYDYKVVEVSGVVPRDARQNLPNNIDVVEVVDVRNVPSSWAQYPLVDVDEIELEEI